MYSNCSFCGERPVVAWFEGPHFRSSVNSPDEVRSEEAWLVCSGCRGLVEADDRDALALRAVGRLRHPRTSHALTSFREFHDHAFWAPRAARGV